MADVLDPEPSTLLCNESKDLCFDDLEIDGDRDDHENPQKDNNQSRPLANTPGSERLIQFQVQSDEEFASLVEREREYLPKQDYLSRLQCGDLDLGARREAFDWIWKVHSYYSFEPLSLYLAVNYLDRFLSIRELPRDKAWPVQLLAVACLSIAAKIEETTVPQSIELQVGDPKFVFEAKTIQRMELLVLDTLNWKMNAVTPFSFLEYSFKKLSDVHDSISLHFTTIDMKNMNRSVQIILFTIRVIDFLEFKPSEIAAAVAMLVSAEIQAVDIDKTISCFIHLEKDRIMNCVEMIKGISMISRSGNRSSGEGEEVALSPIGVLDSAYLSYKSDELSRDGSCTNSSSHMTTTTTSISYGPETKRIKLETTTSTSGLNGNLHL